ncbi:MAG TPA: ChbG/HpnK family deacetylase, partial [Acidobacteriota bacterium]|nr:ChbG/HpnK family deacetylase [Acidobacteriota bacterium]
WGRDRETTERTLECVHCGSVSSVSAMVFMEDSDRAAGLAREHEIDAGLHLNLTTTFSASHCPAPLVEHQRQVAAYLLWHPIARVFFHPALLSSFEYVVSAQREEFARLYGAEPGRIDGHHHMHLCANVLLGGLLPPGILVRRHFSYESGEKILRNAVFRQFTNILLARRHRRVDYFFSLPPLEPRVRLQWIFSLARQFAVEVETHPIHPEEYRFLMGGDVFHWTGDCPIASSFVRAAESRLP